MVDSALPDHAPAAPRVADLSILDALRHGFRRVRAEPGRAVWLFAWDGLTALALFLLGAFVVMTRPDAPNTILGGAFLLALAGRRVLCEAAWLRFMAAEAEPHPAWPWRIGADEGRLLGAGFIAGFVAVAVAALVILPFAFVMGVLIPDPHGMLGWAPMLIMAALWLWLAPRVMITLASTILLKRVAPFEDLAASGRLGGRAALVSALLVAAVFAVFGVASAGMRLTGFAPSAAEVGARVDQLYDWTMAAPLSPADIALVALYAVTASLFWIAARGGATAAARAVADDSRTGEAP